MRARPRRSQVAHRQAMCDGEEPRAESPLVVIAIDATVRAHKSFLDEVLGIRDAAHTLGDESKQWHLIAQDQLLKAAPASVLGALRQFLISQLKARLARHG